MSKGGYRRGRPRVPVESCHSLSAWGYFQFAQMWADRDTEDTFEWEFREDGARIYFTRDGKVHSQDISFRFTPCRFGGRRRWFACPVCRRRVGKVYLPCSMYTGTQRVTRFLCRFCYGLTYLQRQERDNYWTHLHRAARIERLRLGEISSHRIHKRKWQHWRTFEGWRARRNSLLEKAEQALVEAFRKAQS